ncbi:hypothetical protein ACIQ2D_15025 [Lysinibacillus sp. NPDC097287]
MKWLNSKWFDKAFWTAWWLLLIWLLGFIVIGGYFFLLFMSEL